MAYTIEDGYMTCDQVNQNVAQTVKMTVRAPRVANRIFETLEQAQAYVDIYDDTASATPGLVLSVFNDTDENNGIYRVVSVATQSSEVGVLEKIGGDCGIQIIKVVDYDVELRPYMDENVYICIVDRTAINKPSLIYVFEINDSKQQILWGYKGYYLRTYNNVSQQWGPWKWYGYVDGYHTHVSSDVTDSVATLPASADDKDKLVQAGAVERYVEMLGAGQHVPTVDHKLIYSENNETLIAKEFMLPKIYVVDSDEEREACKSDIPALTDTSNVIASWRAYSNSQNMPEYGGGLSFEPDTYTPVGYHQGYQKWSRNAATGHLRTDNVASEFNGYMNLDAASTMNFEVVIGFEDGAASNLMPAGSGETPERGIWLVGNNATARKVTINGVDYFRDTMYDTPENQRTVNNPWRAWVHETTGGADVVFGGYDETNKVSGGTQEFETPALTPSYTLDAFPKVDTSNHITINHFRVSGNTTETLTSPTITSGETTGSMSMLCLTFDNHSFNTIGATVRKFDVSGTNSRFVGGAYCPISQDRGAITVLNNASQNLIGNKETLLTPGSTTVRSMVDYEYTGDSAGQASFIKAHITAENGIVAVEYSDVVTCPTTDIETYLASAGNWNYNGSKLELDFNTKTMKTTTRHTNPGEETVTTTSFASSSFDFTPFLGDLHVMYQSIGSRGSVFMSTRSEQSLNVILDVDDNTVTAFDESTWSYQTSGSTVQELIDIMHGSHMAYNDITQRLWYSNGYEIYEILTGGGKLTAGHLIEITDDNVINALVPDEYHKLIYTEDDEAGEKKLIARGFMYDGEADTQKFYVVADLDEFNECTKSEPYVPDILTYWIQYSDSIYMSEYSSGKTPVASGFGYKQWSGAKDSINHMYNISNDVNSNELNGYINPEETSYINVESILGTTKGSTTGDQIGVSLINTNGVVPKHVIDNDNVKYFRNTLYDKSGKCAWVSEDGITSKVIYAATQSGYEGTPSGNIFKVSDNTIASGRTSPTDTGVAVNITGGIVQANGTVHILCVMTQNATANGGTTCGTWQGNNTAGSWTVVPGTNTLYVYGLTIKIVNGTSTVKSFKPLVSCDSSYQTNVGNQLIPFDSSRNGILANNWSFIKNKFLFEDGVLTVNFSDVKYDSSTSQTAIKTYGDNLLNGTGLPDEGYNGSQLVIDFKSGTYSLLAKGGTVIAGYADKPIIGDSWLDYTQEFIDAFSEKARFMYHAMSFANLYVKTKGVDTYKDRLILRKDNNTAYLYNKTTKQYDILPGAPVDYFFGSHMAYNEITHKLWYSNGVEIYPITAGITQDDIKHEYHPDASLMQSVTIALGGVAAGTAAADLDGMTVSQVFDLLLFPTYIAKLISGTVPTLKDSNGKTSETFEIGDTIPTLTYTKGDAPKATAGNYTAQCTANEGSESITFVQSDFNTVGDKTKTRSTSYTNSTDKIKDTKGNDCPFVHPSQSNFLRADAEAATGSVLAQLKANVDSGTGCLKHNSRSATYTAHVVYPYYAKPNTNAGGVDIDTSGTASSPTTNMGKMVKQAITTNSEFEFTTTFAEVDGDRVSFMVPASFTSIKLLPFNAVAGKYPEDADAATVANNQLTTTTFYIKNTNNITMQYTKYTYNATKANANKYKVKFTKA